MNRKNGCFLAVVAIMVLLGAVFVVSESPSNEHVQRWVDYGILPENIHEHLDAHVTYHNFAILLENLLGYELDERFTFNSGFMYIRRHEALGILQTALGQQPALFHSHVGFLTFGELAEILCDLIQIYIVDDFNLSLADVYLDGALVINHQSLYVDALVSGVVGSGDIVVVGRYDNTIFFDGVDIAGNIIITASQHGLAQVDIRNSRASGLYILGEATVNLLGNTEIENVHISAPATVNTSLLTSRAEPPNVRISTIDASLEGRFGNVEILARQSNSPVTILVEGRVGNLQAEGDVILVGDVIVDTYQAGSLRMINEAGFYRSQEIAAAIEFGVQTAMAYFMEHLLEALANNTPGQAPQFNFTPIRNTPVQTPPETPPQITPPPADPPPAPYN
ncbi:MAG: hypothetical protein FWB98_07190 [Defluviitaleaceae bacterium]|nr:hypothetical protein [Defluviitaleaceae bacterium]